MLASFDTKDKQSFLENNPLPQDRLSKLKEKAGIVLPELYQCARRGDIPADLERIRELLNEAIDREGSRHPINRRCGKTGRNVLHEAATFGHKQIVDLLCDEFGADVGARTLMGNDTPLHFAASKGHRAVCFWLITVYGADPNAVNKYNWTPLHYACQYSSMSVVKCICRYGGRTTHKTDDGDTPIMLAVRRGASETLIDYLAKVSQEQERDRFREDVEGRRREQMELAAIRDKEMSGTREELEKRFLAEQRAEYEKWRHGGDVGECVCAAFSRRSHSGGRGGCCCCCCCCVANFTASPPLRHNAPARTHARTHTWSSKFCLLFRRPPDEHYMHVDKYAPPVFKPRFSFLSDDGRIIREDGTASEVKILGVPVEWKSETTAQFPSVE